MKNLSLILLLLFGYFITATAQDVVQKRAKPYDSWIISRSGPLNFKGTLYDVQDSTIRLASPYRNSIESFNYKDIDRIKIRRKNSVWKGAIIGGVIGVITPFIANPGSGKDYDFTPMINGLLSIPTGLFCAAIGAGIGSIKVTVPIMGNRNNFEAYKNKLNYFASNKGSDPVAGSWIDAPNQQTGITPSIKRPISPEGYEHESYISFMNGPSYPMGYLNSDIMINNRKFKAIKGNHANVLNIGYRLKGKLGISFAWFQDQYEALSSDPDEWWMLLGIAAGPMYSYKLGRKFIFDLKPRIGLASLALNTNVNNQTSSSGLVLNPCVGFRYNFHRRWCAISEAGYFYSRHNVNAIGSKNIQSLNLGIGIGYRYK